jgi:hypothetical protein
MDEMKMEDANKIHGDSLENQEEIIDEKKKGKLLFPIPVVFGAGIAMFLIFLAVFAGQVELQRQLGARVRGTPVISMTPAMSETPVQPSGEPNPSDFPPCPGVDPNNPPSDEFIDEPGATSVSFPSQANVPEECELAGCRMNFKGKDRTFEGKQECIKDQPEHCIGEKMEGEVEKIVVEKCKFLGVVSDKSCNHYRHEVSVENDMCSNSLIEENCPDVDDVITTDTECLACWDWVWEENNDGVQRRTKQDVFCVATDSEEVRTTIDKCEKVPEIKGVEGWRIDRSTCAYDPNISAPASACYQSCQIYYADPDNNCEEEPKAPGECVLKRAEESSSPTTPPTNSPSDSPLI